MKKALSILLSVLVIFSMLGMVAAAEDTAAPEESQLVTVEFVVEGVTVRKIRVLPGVSFVSRLAPGGDAELAVPTKAPADGKEYIFKGWENQDSLILSTTGNIPAADKDTVYVAVFASEEIKETQSFWAFVQSIFARINMIFEYFAKVFEGVFDF